MIENYLNMEWEVRLCGEGESCWCRLVCVKDNDTEDGCIIGFGAVNKEEAEHIVAAHNEYLLETVRNAESQAWYCNALDVLSPLRTCTQELLLGIKSYEDYAKRVGSPFFISGLKEAKLALENAEVFFTGLRPEDGNDER